MQNFLAQFTGLTEAQKLRFESFIFNQASGMIVGYNGGSWASVKCGEVWGLVIPGKSLSVTINTPFGGSSTANNESASIAFTMLVNNWFWNLLSEQEQCSDKAHKEFSAVHFGLRDAAYADDSEYDTSAIFDLTD